ncbi:hypothetical protein B7486_34820 [cyanobacterium TDX16]|nr:hypothetical protein B7486_34820 [cyanobacterium TDX16]
MVSEIRGIWITNTDSAVLNSQANIAEAMNFLAATGFNVVFPVVWSKGATVYPSQVMRSQFGLAIDPRYTDREPLAELVAEARRVELKVIPWFEYGFASSYNQNGGQLLAKKPEWAARDCNGNLLKKNGFEWMNALDSQVQGFLLSLILEVVNNYDIDGIQGDDRIPAMPCEGGYDAGTVARYRQKFRRQPPSNPQDRRWLQWRADILTNFLARLNREVKAVNPNLLISMAPSIYDWGYKEYLQDSQTWLQRGLVDLLHPQAYRRDFNSYKQIIERLVREQVAPQQRSRVAPGVLLNISSYRMTPQYLSQAIAHNRDCGINGEVFFFYEGLRSDNNALAKVLRNGAYAKSAAFPSVANLTQPQPENASSSVARGIQNLLKLWQRF